MTSKSAKVYNQSKGFTVLELMIATSVFAAILLVAAAGILAFTKSYFSGVTSTTAQTAGRLIINDIARNIQLGGSDSVINDTVRGVLCFNGSIQYQYRLGVQVNNASNTHALVRDSNATCASDISLTSPLSASQQELLGDHMRLAALSVTKINHASGAVPTFLLHVRVVYGDYDLLTANGSTLTGTETPAWWAANGSNVRCRSTVGSQFCAVSDAETTVQSRL